MSKHLTSSIVGRSLSAVELARKASLEYLRNPVLIGPVRYPVDIYVHNINITTTEESGYMVRVTIKETVDGVPSIGGSSFHADIRYGICHS